MAPIRRHNTRFNVNYDFEYYYNEKSSKCVILNISESGMLLKIPQILDVGDMINIYFEHDLQKEKHENGTKEGILP